MKRSLKILIIEDSADDTELMLLNLEQYGFETISRRVDTKEALALALDETVWDIILSDYTMPGFDAITALKTVQDKKLDTPFIIVSGTIGETTAVAAIKAGAHDFLLKDYLEKLAATVERQLGEAEARRERRKAEAAIRESEERFRVIIEAIRDYAIFMINLDGHISSWNTGAERVLGYKESEILGKPLSILLHDQDQHALASPKALEQAARLGRAESEEWYKKKNGTCFWASGVIHPIEKTNGGRQGFVVVLRDHTHQKLAEEKLRQSEEFSRKANRMKDEFLATLSHELRTPLNAITGYAELLYTEQPGTQEFRDCIDAIIRNGKIQEQLMNDLLDVSKIISGKLNLAIQRLNITQVIEDAIHSLHLAARAKGHSISKVFAAHPLPISGDGDRLRQVFWNLLSNALKFTPAGGTIRIETMNDDTHVVVKVIDSGKGIDAEFLPYVFERFRQEDASSTRFYGGLGLGLAIVRHIVELHGGTVEAISDGKDQGTTFTVSLPISLDSKPGRVVETSATPPPMSSPLYHGTLLNGLRVLIIDDHLDACKLVTRILSLSGAQVFPASSTSEAFALYQSKGFDLILCDIGLPEESGLTFIRRLREFEASEGTPMTPAAAITAFAAEKDRQDALAAGFQSYLTKPIRPKELVEQIITLIRAESSK